MTFSFEWYFALPMPQLVQQSNLAKTLPISQLIGQKSLIVDNDHLRPKTGTWV